MHQLRTLLAWHGHFFSALTRFCDDCWQESEKHPNRRPEQKIRLDGEQESPDDNVRRAGSGTGGFSELRELSPSVWWKNSGGASTRTNSVLNRSMIECKVEFLNQSRSKATDNDQFQLVEFDRFLRIPYLLRTMTTGVFSPPLTRTPTVTPHRQNAYYDVFVFLRLICCVYTYRIRLIICYTHTYAYSNPIRWPYHFHVLNSNTLLPT